MQKRTPEIFAAIGRLIQEKDLRDVCVMEFERGVIITGTVLPETVEGFYRRVETLILTDEDLVTRTEALTL